MHAVKMTDGNLALDCSRSDAPAFSVIPGGRSDAPARVRAEHAAAPLASVRSLVLAVLLAVTAFSAVPSVMGRISFESALANTATRTIEVSSGDSLWVLAELHPVEGMSTSDTVRLMKEWNSLDQGMLVPGQDLIVAAG